MDDIGIDEQLTKDLWCAWCYMDKDENESISADECVAALESFGKKVSNFKIFYP